MSIVLFTTKNKQNPLNPVQLSNRKNPSRGSYESKAGHVLAVWPQTWDVFGHSCIVL